jgi:universal stress protein E
MAAAPPRANAYATDHPRKRQTMNRIRRILVAVKQPSAGVPVLARKAAQLARATRAELELFHALDSPVFIDPLTSTSADQREYQVGVKQRALEGLGRIAAALKRYSVRITTTAAWDYPASEAIVRRARSLGADLIVVGLHPGKRKYTWMPGLTDWDVLRASPVPVLLVKTARPFRKPALLAAIDPLHAYAKPTGLDSEILQVADGFARALKGTVHAMHSYLPNIYAVPPGPSADAAARVLDASQRAARTRFDKALVSSGIPAGRRYLISAHPVDAIPDTAKRISGSIVVMGAISRSGFRRLFIGNTAERVLDRLGCDVLVVKPPRFASRVQRMRRGTRIVVTGLPIYS